MVAREPQAVPSRPAPSATHILKWRAREQTLSRVELPLWMSVVATEPIPLEAFVGLEQRGLSALLEARDRANALNIRIDDLKRYGRTLLLDGVTADGEHVLMWNE